MRVERKDAHGNAIDFTGLLQIGETWRSVEEQSRGSSSRVWKKQWRCQRGCLRKIGDLSIRVLLSANSESAWLLCHVNGGNPVEFFW